MTPRLPAPATGGRPTPCCAAPAARRGGPRQPGPAPPPPTPTRDTRGKPVGPEVEAWFRKRPPGFVAGWAKDNPAVAEQYVKENPEAVAGWFKENLATYRG